MKLPPGKTIDEFMELQFKPSSWEKSGIPQKGCRIRQATLERLLKQRGVYEIDDLVYGLMEWLDVTDHPQPALKTLGELLDRHYPADGRASARCHFLDEHGVVRIFHAGAIDCDRPLVAWQRREWMIAAAQPASEPTRMMVGAPQAISLSVALRILALSAVKNMAEPFDSYVGARTTCGSTAAFYRRAAGETTPILWDEGLNRRREGEELVCCEEVEHPRETGWLPPNQLAMQVAIAAGYLK